MYKAIPREKEFRETPETVFRVLIKWLPFFFFFVSRQKHHMPRLTPVSVVFAERQNSSSNRLGEKSQNYTPFIVSE